MYVCKMEVNLFLTTLGFCFVLFVCLCARALNTYV